MSELIPAGFYRARCCAEPELGVAKTGTDLIQMQFQVVDGQFAGRRVNYRGYFTDKTAKRTFDSLRYCGCTFPGNDLTNFSGYDTNEVQLDVVHEQAQEPDENGEKRIFAKVAWVNSLAGKGLSPERKMDQYKKEDFKSKMLGKFLESKGADSTPESDTNGGSGDLPF